MFDIQIFLFCFAFLKVSLQGYTVLGFCKYDNKKYTSTNHMHMKNSEYVHLLKCLCYLKKSSKLHLENEWEYIKFAESVTNDGVMHCIVHSNEFLHYITMYTSWNSALATFFLSKIQIGLNYLYFRPSKISCLLLQYCILLIGNNIYLQGE